MKIGFIGAGKVGCTFGRYLKQKGFNIYGYYSKTYASSKKAAKLTDSKAVIKVKEMMDHTDMVFITTSDDAIESVCNELALKNTLSKGKILVHMSGTASSNVLQKAREKGCFVYALHPLQAFADVDKALDELSSTVFSLEGDEQKMWVMKDLLKTMKNPYFMITHDQKSIYHATACIVSNYLVTLIDYGLSLFESIGIDPKEGYVALYPLIKGTIDNIKNLGTKDSLTGPIARGDVGTVKKHIQSLEKYNKEDLRFYKELGKKTLDLAKKKHPFENLASLEKILK